MSERLESRAQEDLSEHIRGVFEGRVPIEITTEERKSHHLLAVGPFDHDALHTSTGEVPKLSEAESSALDFVKKYVTSFLDETNKTRKKPQQDWPKMHVSKVHEHDGECDVEFVDGWGSYGKHLALGGDGINKAYDEYSDQAGDKKISRERFTELFQPMVPAVCGMILTSDNQILLTKRHPEKVGTYGESWHLPGGYIDATDKRIDDTSVSAEQPIDPFVSMKREITEEVGLTAEQIGMLVCAGVVRDPKESNLSFLFLATTNLRSGEIVNRKEHEQSDRLLLRPKDIDGDVRAKPLLTSIGIETKILPALSKIDEFFVKKNKELTVPSSKTLAFLVEKMIKTKK